MYLSFPRDSWLFVVLILLPLHPFPFSKQAVITSILIADVNDQPGSQSCEVQQSHRVGPLNDASRLMPRRSRKSMPAGALNTVSSTTALFSSKTKLPLPKSSSKSWPANSLRSLNKFRVLIFGDSARVHPCPISWLPRYSSAAIPNISRVQAQQTRYFLDRH